MLQATFPLSSDRNNAWEWSYGKHDEPEFTGLNILWVGTILDEISWIAIVRTGIFWVGIFQVGVILGGNFPGGSYPGWEFSLVEIFRVGIVRGQSSGWECSQYRIFVDWKFYFSHMKLNASSF